MESNTDFYDMWLKSQKQFVDGWLDSIKNMQDAFGGSKDFSNPAGGAFNLYNSWLKTVGISFDNLMKNFSSDSGRDAFSKLFSGADAYMKVFEFWSPLQKAMLNKEINPEVYLDLFKPAMYKEVIDKIFGFNNADSMKEFYGYASKLIDTWGGSSQNIIKPWLDAMQRSGTPFMSFAGGDMDAGLKIFQNAYSAFDGTFGKAFKMPAVGKDREKFELILSCFDKYSNYQKNYVEFQHLTYKTSNEASKKLFETITAKIKNGEKIETYGEFFKLWMEENEKTFNVLFKTDEFSKIQANVLDTALATKRQFAKLIELLLEDYPIALRSEVDDAYKMIHDLKKRVRALEQKANN
ncbi:MAG: hypothetical protein HQK91_03465 [Nitrospirae bacterium]|nr:hypothetical protein [Nitrospirota bacterium]MBF0540495.1 hypothetical protein [Nitrospirota bacterium]